MTDKIPPPINFTRPLRSTWVSDPIPPHPHGPTGYRLQQQIDQDVTVEKDEMSPRN